METRFFACSGVVDHTNELKFSVNLTQIKKKKPTGSKLVNNYIKRFKPHSQAIVGFHVGPLHLFSVKT